jgi:ankyrin repeat protein
MLNQVNINGIPLHLSVSILDFCDSMSRQACDNAYQEVFTNFYTQQMRLYETTSSPLTELLITTALSPSTQQLAQKIHLQVAEITHIMANTLADQETGWTYLHKACSEGDKIWVEFLLLARGIDIHKVDRNGATAFHLACQNGYSEIVKP